MTTINDEIFLRRREAAESLGVSLDTIDRLLESDRLSKFEFLSGQILIRQSELENLKAASLKLVSHAAHSRLVTITR
jgi:excisionase family DNA binding protein